MGVAGRTIGRLCDLPQPEKPEPVRCRFAGCKRPAVVTIRVVWQSGAVDEHPFCPFHGARKHTRPECWAPYHDDVVTKTERLRLGTKELLT